METLRKEAISEVHFQHTQWINLLDFYREELNIFQRRLDEIAFKNNGKEVQQLIEKYQNTFIIQHNNIANLGNLINAIEKQTVDAGKLHLRRIDYEASQFYIELQGRVSQFEISHKKLKTDFLNFLSKRM